MKKLSPLYALLFTLFLFGAGLRAVTPAQLKSKHFMLLGMQNEVEQNICEAYEYYRLAYQLDPNNKMAANRYGFYYQFKGDSIVPDKEKALIREFIEAYPEEYTESSQYVNLCTLQGDFPEAFRVLKRLHSIYPDRTDILNELAMTALYMEMHDSTIYYLNEQEKIEGPSPALTHAKIITYLAQGDTINVLSESDRAIRENPSSPLFYLMKGSVLEHLGRGEEAMPIYMEADSLFPDNWDIKQYMAYYYKEKGDSVAMDKAVLQALQTEDGDIEDKIELFSEYVSPIIEDKAPTEVADRLMDSLLEQYPYEPTIASLAAQYSNAKGNMDEAIDRAIIAVDMASDNIDYRTMLINYLVMSERYAEAVDLFVNTPDMENASPLMYILASNAYHGLKRYDEALETVDSLINQLLPDKNPLDVTMAELRLTLSETGMEMLASAEGERANILFELDKPQDAADAYEFALKLIPDDLWMLNNYAYFSATKGLDLQKAAEMSLKTITENPDNPIFLDSYAYILFLQGEYVQAAEYMEKAIAGLEEENLSDTSEYWEHYGDILSKIGETDRALEMWRKALKLSPERTILKDKIKAKKYIEENNAH